MSGRSTRNSKNSATKENPPERSRTEGDVEELDDSRNEKKDVIDDVVLTEENSSDESKVDSDDANGEGTDKNSALTEESSNNPVLLMAGILVPIVLVAFALFFTTKETAHIDIQANLKALFRDFKNQPEITHRKLKSRAGTFLNHTTSPQPFVLMVSACDSDSFTASCFANRVGQLFTSSPLIIQSSVYSHIDAEQAKLEIDQKLVEIFQTDQFPSVAVIHNLLEIPYEASMLFYKYCDHDQPSFKEVAIIFTVTIPQEFCTMSNTSEVENDGLVETYISEHSPWVHNDNFDIDKVAALLSRISDIVIFLRGENTKVLKNICTI